MYFSGSTLSDSLTLNDTSSITANRAGGNGGGVFSFSQVLLNDTSSITANEAGGNGGGVYGSSVVLNGGSVTGNTPDDIYP